MHPLFSEENNFFRDDYLAQQKATSSRCVLADEPAKPHYVTCTPLPFDDGGYSRPSHPRWMWSLCTNHPADEIKMFLNRVARSIVRRARPRFKRRDARAARFSQSFSPSTASID